MEIPKVILGISTHCKRCNKKLKSEKSRILGFGSACKNKYDEENALLQMEIFEFLEDDIDVND